MHKYLPRNFLGSVVNEAAFKNNLRVILNGGGEVVSQHPILYITENELEHTVESMLSEGYKIFKLDGSRVKDAETFFAEVIRKLPLDAS